MAIKTDTFTGGGGGGGGAVDSVNGDTGVVVVTLDGVTDQNASTTNAITVGGVTIGTEYSLPTTDGASGQALTTNGTGTLSFTNITSDVTSVNTQTGAVTLSANDLAADHTASNYTASNANIDGHLSGIDTKLGTLTAGLTYQGSYNANTNSPSLANAEQGDLYIVSVAGTQFGETWAVGDHLLVNADMGGVIDNSKIDKIDNTDQVTSVNTQTGAVVLSGDDLAADHTAVNYTASNANIDGHLSGIDTKLGTLLSDITGESLNDLSDVSFTAGAGIDNYVLKYDNGTSSWGAEAESTAAAASETVAGVIEIATNAEASAGTATDKALVPSNVPSLDLSAMDNTTSAFISDITSESLNDLSDVSFTAGAGIDNYVLTYDNGTSSWGAELVPSAPVTSVNTLTGAVVVSGDDIAADHTAVNYTASNANIDGHLSGIDSALGASVSPTLDNVTTNGDTTTNAINVGTITTSGNVLADSADTRTIGAEATRFITYYGDMNGAIRFKAKNDEGAQITKGQAVYIKGLAGDGTTPTVGLADANDSAKMPAFGLAFNTANDSAEIQIISVGNLGGLNTSGFSVGDTLFVDTTAGALTDTKPTGESSQLQNIGRVIRSNNGAGVIMVGGAGRSAATPNLDQDKVFLGNASNQAVSTALSAIGLSKLNNDSGFISDITSESLNDLSDVSFTAGAGIDNYVLTYDHATTSWGAEAAASAPVTSVNTLTGAVVVSGDDIAADHTATNYTASNANVDGHLSGIDTKLGTLLSDITGESLNDLSDVSFTAGAGIDNYVLKYDNGTNSWGAEAESTAAAASETVAGVIEIATNAEATAGTATDKALVPSNISSLDLSDMDNTTAGFISGITGESLNDLSDVSFTAGAGIDNYVLTYDHSTTSWGAEAAAGASAPSVTAQNTTATLSAPSAGTLEEVYTVNSASAVTLTLVSAATVGEGFKYQIKRLGAGDVIVDPASTEYIDHSGQTTFSIGAQYDSITLISDGTNWLLI